MRTATYSRASVTQTLDSVHADLDVLSLPSFMFLESFGRLNNNHTNNKKKNETGANYNNNNNNKKETGADQDGGKMAVLASH